MTRKPGWGPGRDWGYKEYIKYGGVAFTNNVTPEEINEFVHSLPDEDRESMYEVVKRLSEEGLITLHQGDLSTADDEMEPYLETGDEALPGTPHDT